MTSTRIEWSFNKVSRMTDLSDLAEMLFPGNRNQQYAFLLLWISIKWADGELVPNLSEVVHRHGVSRRTFERVRAKMRRMGLIDHVSRFNARYGHREGWVLSTRFEKSLGQLARKAAAFGDTAVGFHDKDLLLLELARGRRDVGNSEHRHSLGEDDLPLNRGD